ncbi:nucleoside deaminase [Rhodobacteraceae bacterium RKSG542]|nr:nucleoside deaminase [Pseudovibrio flavus]
MRKTFEMAEECVDKGVMPFCCILVDADGTILMEQVNAFLPLQDETGHAERVLATRASQKFGAEFLSKCTMYTNVGPCAMCAGAVYWAGIGRIVYGMSERKLGDFVEDNPMNPMMDMPAEEVFAKGTRKVECVGPIATEEASRAHIRFWGEQNAKRRAEASAA